MAVQDVAARGFADTADLRELREQLADLGGDGDDRFSCGSGNGGGVCAVASLAHSIEVRRLQSPLALRHRRQPHAMMAVQRESKVISRC